MCLCVCFFWWGPCYLLWLGIFLWDVGPQEWLDVTSCNSKVELLQIRIQTQMNSGYMTIADGFVLLTIWEFEFICVIHEIFSIHGKIHHWQSADCRYPCPTSANMMMMMMMMLLCSRWNRILCWSRRFESILLASVNHLVNAMLPHSFRYLWFLNPTAHN